MLFDANSVGAKLPQALDLPALFHGRLYAFDCRVFLEKLLGALVSRNWAMIAIRRTPGTCCTIWGFSSINKAHMNIPLRSERTCLCLPVTSQIWLGNQEPMRQFKDIACLSRESWAVIQGFRVGHEAYVWAS